MMNSRTVIMGHPGKQHSHHFAEALTEFDILDQYVSGQFRLQDVEKVPSFIRSRLPSVIMRNAINFPDSSIYTTFPIASALGWISRGLPIYISLLLEYFGFKLFDMKLASVLDCSKHKVVIAYEMAAYHSFVKAKECHALCILDAAACDYRLQDRMMPHNAASEPKFLAKIIREKKDDELKLADYVICPSELSAQSYIDAGVSSNKVLINPLGVDVDRFNAIDLDLRSGIVRFVFIGNAAYVKGLDRVCETVEFLKSNEIEAEFDFIGGATPSLSSGKGVTIRVHGHMNHDDLSSLLIKSDCLLLPSRLESFGMVVLEAMACGVPVVVTKWVGASMFVQNDVNGWVIEDDEQSLNDLVLAIAKHPTVSRTMRSVCVSTAKKHTWNEYKKRSAEIINNILQTTK